VAYSVVRFTDWSGFFTGVPDSSVSFGMTLWLITCSISHGSTLKATFAHFLQKQPTGEIVFNNPYFYTVLFSLLFTGRLNLLSGYWK
jgi:hypothetical protein